jgi:DNA repair protein RecO (recombination protein O)
MLRLFTEQEANTRAFRALTRFLELLDTAPSERPAKRPALDPLALSFQLKLLWVSGYLPHVTDCAECGAQAHLVGYSPRAGGAVCSSCRDETTLTLGPESLGGIEALLRRPLADAEAAGLSPRAARDALAVINSSYEFHGGFRLRTLSV